VFALSSVLELRPLEHLVDEAIRRAGRGRLQAMLSRHPGRPGSARLRRLMDPARPSSETWSAAEERLLRLIRRSGLPAPEHNVPIGRYVPDLLWREQRVIVEYDSREYHSGDLARRRDSERHNEFTAAGYRVLHVTWEQLSGAPERLLVLIATTLARAA
jgi:very-short-patch-repair endonuclease